METFNMQTEMIGKQVIDFWADWCGPCRQLAPIFEDVSNEQYLLERGLKFYKTNVDFDGDTSNKWVIRSVPTILLLKDGKEVNRIVGVLPKTKLLDKLADFSRS